MASTPEVGQSSKPKTKLIYTPFLDKTRSDPLIMMTVMIKAEIPTNKCVRHIQYLRQISSYIV